MYQSWSGCDLEAQHLRENRKEEKLRVKIAQRTDRSQHKKTDQKAKIHNASEVVDPSWKKGRVVGIAADSVSVQVGLQCMETSLRGALKKNLLALKNLLTIGDEVLIDEELQIAKILPRRTLLARQDHFNKRSAQMIAANVDQLLIIVAVKEPGLTPHLIDRYLIAAKMGNIPAVIVINKIDLLASTSASEQAIFHEMLRIYPSLGIPLFCISTKTHEGLETPSEQKPPRLFDSSQTPATLQDVLKHKSSLLAGHSGTGKTSLLNVLTDSTYMTGELVGKTNRGAHTTTRSIIVPLACQGECIDTPGIRSLGLWKLSLQDIQEGFPEFAPFAAECHFFNCRHCSEPECGVKEALEKGLISKMRYNSYQQLLKEL